MSGPAILFVLHGSLAFFRLNVARLANVPPAVLDLAAIKSKELEEEVQAKGLTSL